jgi:hypothetical protein
VGVLRVLYAYKIEFESFIRSRGPVGRPHLVAITRSFLFQSQSGPKTLHVTSHSSTFTIIVMHGRTRLQTVPLNNASEDLTQPVETRDPESGIHWQSGTLARPKAVAPQYGTRAFGIIGPCSVTD